jgi:hypothetical protein
MEQAAEKAARWWLWILVAGLFLAGFLVPLHLNPYDATRERLFDAAHAPAFAVFTLFLASRLPSGWALVRRLAWTFGTAVLVAVGIEFLQKLTGRETSFTDILNGVIGAFLAVLWCAMWPAGFANRALFIFYAAAVSAAMVLPAWRQWGSICWRQLHFPLIADFESRAEFRPWWTVIANEIPPGSTILPSVRGVSHGKGAARVSMFGKHYPGVRIVTADQDWSSYRTLAFDVLNPGRPFELSLRVDDNLPITTLNDYFVCALSMKSGWNHVRIPLADIQRARNRSFNIASVRKLIFFLDQPREPHVFYLDWIRLE